MHECVGGCVGVNVCLFPSRHVRLLVRVLPEQNYIVLTSLHLLVAIRKCSHAAAALNHRVLFIRSRCYHHHLMVVCEINHLLLLLVTAHLESIRSSRTKRTLYFPRIFKSLLVE